MQKTNKFKYIFAAILIAIIMIISSVWNGGAAVVYADTSIDTKAAYEQQNVLDDLNGSVIAGEKFSLSDYLFDEILKPQIIQFVEFGYSARSSNQGDYGLYIYVYNPQGLAIDTDASRNKIQIKIGTANYTSYELEFLNYSNTRGYEGLFYKFKISIPDRVLKQALNDLSQDNRVYEVSGITLSVKRELTEYAVAQTYTYSGYASGYGTDTMIESTLTCAVDGLDVYVELGVNHTVYRAKGDYYNGEQSQLNSCYFRVPNKFFTDYGKLTEIACEWYEYFTKPILVTEDNYTYNKISALHGKNTETLSDDMYFLFNVMWENSKTSWFKKSGVSDWTSNYSYEIGDSYHWGFLWLSGAEVTYAPFDNFAATFYTGGESCENYEVNGADLRTVLLSNSDYIGAPYIHGNYSSALFENYVQAGRTYGYNHKEIKATDKFDIFWNYTTKSLWQKIFTGEQDVDTVYESLDAIVTVKDSDLSGKDNEIAERLKISESDVDKLKAEQKKAKANDETLVMFRYGSTKYFCAPAVSSYCSASKIDGGKTLVKENVEKWSNNDFNAYVCQETVYLDFDIISLTYTMNGVETVIPVVSSPQDVISSLTPPLEEPADNSLSIFALILGAVALIVIFILLFKFAPGVVTIIGKILLFPFTCIWELFKAIGNSVKLRKKRKEKKAQSEQETNQPKPPELKGNVKPEEVDAYLDSIDWDSVDWTKLDGKSG